MSTYYKTLGFLTHRGILWYLRRKLPARQQVATAAAVGTVSLFLIGAATLALRSRRTQPTV